MLSKRTKLVLVSIASLVVVFLILTMIHILQSAPGGWNNKSIEEMVGKPVETIRFNDIKNMSKTELTQIFYAADTPVLNDLSGEFNGSLAPVGAIYFTGAFFTYFIYGGMDKWVGKEFNNCPGDTCTGNNLFIDRNDVNKIIKKREIATYIKTSNLDDRDSMYLDYSPYNSGIVENFRDELRQINNELYIGIGYLTFPSGPVINYPFFLYLKKD